MMSLSNRRVLQRGGSLPDGVLQDRISGEVGWQQITYTYDPFGRRIAKDVDGVVTKYVYDGDQCIAEYDANDVLLRKYVYGPGIDQPICMIEAAGGYAGTYYYHFDALGSVVALSDAGGDTVQVYEYDVYGQVAASDPNHPNRFLFTGREFDAETGLYYYRARYYNPTIGRFLQTDPIGYDDGMNLYRYCDNNPWDMADPYGEVPVVPWEFNDCNTEPNYDINSTSCWAGEAATQIYAVGPLDASKANGCKNEALRKAQDSGLPGAVDGPQDAFRHCLWSCCMAKEIGPDQAEKVGNVHEKCSPGTAESTEMDQANNKLGRGYGASGLNCSYECYNAVRKGYLQLHPRGHMPTEAETIRQRFRRTEKQQG